MSKRQAANPPPKRPPPDDPLLTRASVRFHTNDEDKDADSRVQVDIRLSDNRTLVATISDFFEHFNDHSDAGPFTLLMVNPVSRGKLRTGNVQVLMQATPAVPPFGHGDTWRFNFLVDMFFSDGSHLLARANGIELKSRDLSDHQSFGIE